MGDNKRAQEAGRETKPLRQQAPEHGAHGMESIVQTVVDPAAALLLAKSGPFSSIRPEAILALQRTGGNRAVQRLLASRKHQLLHAESRAHMETPFDREDGNAQEQAAEGAWPGRENEPDAAFQKKPLSLASVTSIQRKGDSPATIQKRYGIILVKGDKGWTEDEAQWLGQVLSKLTPGELARLKGLPFYRYSKQEKDPQYKKGDKEADAVYRGVVGTSGGIEKLVSPTICVYDSAVDKNEFMATDEKMAQAGEGIPEAVWNTMHEIGHAVYYSKHVETWNAYRRAYHAWKTAYDAYEGETDPKKKASLVPRVKNLDKKADEAEKRYDKQKDEVEREFKAIVKKYKVPAVTEYAKTNIHEFFAEVFALYKLDPATLKTKVKGGKQLLAWFGKRWGAGKGKKKKSKK